MGSPGRAAATICSWPPGTRQRRPSGRAWGPRRRRVNLAPDGRSVWLIFISEASSGRPCAEALTRFFKKVTMLCRHRRDFLVLTVLRKQPARRSLDTPSAASGQGGVLPAAGRRRGPPPCCRAGSRRVGEAEAGDGVCAHASPCRDHVEVPLCGVLAPAVCGSQAHTHTRVNTYAAHVHNYLGESTCTSDWPLLDLCSWRAHCVTGVQTHTLTECVFAQLPERTHAQTRS